MLEKVWSEEEIEELIEKSARTGSFAYLKQNAPSIVRQLLAQLREARKKLNGVADHWEEREREARKETAREIVQPLYENRYEPDKLLIIIERFYNRYGLEEK